ncbi:MAG: [FeFe] hydrogenase H-cluster radical SAM maturase HydE [candidate division FCPU426 bacterium]
MNRHELLEWLRTDDPRSLQRLWRLADAARKKHVGDAVHLRGLLEISNYCSRACWYCGLRGGRRGLKRYRMTRAEIEACVRQLAAFGYGTVVLQSGEDPGLAPERISRLVAWIKAHTALAVTLSLGEQPRAVLRQWREAGADRYLLRIETTNRRLLARIHPGEPHGSRMTQLRWLRQLGYEVGSGIMVGIPGQTYDMLVKDLLWFKTMDLDMIGIGPFIPHPDTPLFALRRKKPPAPGQVPATEIMVNKVVALARLMCPEANLPATTALASINAVSGREQALSHGANVVMPNVTPQQYRVLYDIYPGKACVSETAEVCHACIRRRIEKLGRTIGSGPGGRVKRKSGVR